MIKFILLVAQQLIKNCNEMCFFKYRKRTTLSFYNPNLCHWRFKSYFEWPTMTLVNSLVLCLTTVWLKKKESHSKIYCNHQKKVWQIEFRMTCPSLSLSFSLGYLVIVKIYMINTSTVEPKCLCCSDWKHSQIFRNSFGKIYPWLNIYICSSLTKSENEHL